MAYAPMKNYPHDTWCDKCGRLFPAYLPCQTCPKCVQADAKSTFDGFNAKFRAIGSQPMFMAVDFAKAEEKVFASMTPSEQLLYTPPQHEVHDAFAWPTTTKIVSTKVVPLTHTELFTNQRFIMRVGMLSNCNITVQQFVKPDQVTAAYRLFCTNCRDALLISDYKTLNGQMTEVWISNAEAFCTAHKHDTQVTQTVTTGVSVEIRAGRKYRDE